MRKSIVWKGMTFKGDPEKVYNEIQSLGEATPEDVVGTAIFLASHASDFMTGNILYPDGGLTCVG